MEMNHDHIDLTATEIGDLWATYQSETLSYCMLKYFDGIVEDPNIKQLNKQSLDLCQVNINRMKEMFKKERFPIPVGFTDEDVMTGAGPLYTDTFILLFQWYVNKAKMNYGSSAINTIAREDVFSFFETYISEGLHLLKKSRDLLLHKGLWLRAPYIPIPKEVEFVKKESFLHTWIGKERPLSGTEIGSLFYNIINNSIGVMLMNSFLQVTQGKEIHNYFKRGKEIAEKHVEVLTQLLKQEDLVPATSWNGGITASNVPPFSEKLMLTFVSLLNAQGISNYGTAISNSTRKDLATDFARLSAEVGQYAEDGSKMLIHYGWMEQPPIGKGKVK